MSRKPPQRATLLVLNARPDSAITQNELEELEKAQQAEWHASRRAALLSERIRERMQRGVPTVDGPLFYDQELNMARGSRRKKEA